ncbi:MAG: NUDIX hydrolase [Ignavibacteriales bacterium]
MVLTNRNDYKFPGGGIQPKENIEEALIREVEEETGYVVKNTKERLGVIVQRDIDKYEKDAIFEMTSYYYLCEVTGTKFEQRLDDYEEEQNFHPVWITIEAAINLKKGKTI